MRVLIAAVLFTAGELQAQAATPSAIPRTRLAACRIPRVPVEVRCGSLDVLENRASRTGRRITLPIVVLPSRRATAAPDPVFFIAGGPGQSATALAPMLWRSSHRDEREIVLVDQRGTGGAPVLHCDAPGSDDDLQGYFEPMFRAPLYAACARTLGSMADLRHYSTYDAADDLEDVRAALGYERINLVGASYGTRLSLAYMRRHPTRVRAAILSGLVPTSFRNPLHHARSAQDALDSLLAACERDAPCRRAYPRLRAQLDEVVRRLDRAPAEAVVWHPVTRAPARVRLSRSAFGEALRVMMYSTDRITSIPLLIDRAHRGDLTPFAAIALESSRNLRRDLRFGVLMSVVCAEDVPRIRESEIARETRGTLIGDERVRTQMAACASWPKAELSRDHGVPAESRVPTLLISGTLDPVTPPRWGAEAARHLPNAVHLVVPGGHTPQSPCLDAIARRVLERASAQGLDTSCVRGMTLPPFALP